MHSTHAGNSTRVVVSFDEQPTRRIEEPRLSPFSVAAQEATRYGARAMTDRSYWDSFYSDVHPDIEKPSSLAMWCLPMLAANCRLVEFGCGNGRDALFFAHHGIQVIACDQSTVAIESLNVRQAERDKGDNPRFVACDFTNLAHAQFDTLDAVYSRFTLHAITAAEASSALAWATTSLRPNGLVLIEVRSVNGDLYGKGEPREKDAFVYDGHYRRFVRMQELKLELEGLGFTIEQAIESAGLSVFKDDDPVVIRMVARRMSRSLERVEL